MRATFSDEDLAALDARVAQLPRNRAASGSQVQQDSVLGDFSSTLFVDTIYGGAKALVTGEAGRALGERGVGIVETLTNRSFTGTPSDYARLTRAFLGDLTGVNAGVEAYYGYDISNQQELSDFERLSRGVNSVTQLSGGAAGILKFRGGRVAPVRPHANIPDHPSVGPGKPFTQSQKKKILEANRKANEGVLRSEQSGQALVPAKKSQKGVTPPKNEAQIDHIVPRSKNGTNSFSNAQVLSREENIRKSNK